MKIKVNILLTILILSMVLFVGCKKDLEIEEPLNPIEDEEEANTDGVEDGEEDDNEEDLLGVISMDMAIVEDDILLVPARNFAEKLGAQVTWDSNKKTMLIEKEEKSLLFKIGSRLINYNKGEDYELSNIRPRLFNKDDNGDLMAYLPLQIISKALNIEAVWNEDEKNIYIKAQNEREKEFGSNIEITSQNKGDIIKGKTIFQVKAKKEYEKASEIHFMLLEKGQTSGFIVEKGNNITGEYTYIPKIEDNGQKILLAMVYDKKGEFLDGHAIGIEIRLEPQVTLLGVNENDLITTTATLSTKTNFLPLYVKYEITEIGESGEGKKILTDLRDPLDTFTWNPMMNDNKTHSIRAVAYDERGNSYYSQGRSLVVNKARILTLSGVKANMTIDKEVTLMANRNFDVSQTEYLIRDVNTGNVSTLENIPYGGYKWNPGPDDSGIKELFVRVIDRGQSYESDPIRVTVDGKAKMFLTGIGPGQVVNKAAELSMNSNVDLENIKYIVRDSNANIQREIPANSLDNSATYSPIESDKANMTIEVQGEYQGKIISSEKVKFKVYHGEFYGPKAIVEKDRFIPLVSKLALGTYEEIGMSASLQTAQAILESGWGQSVPVDKYTGVLSNNLFGIKGKGTIGSVVSNTWEVYNGVTYRIDDNFRAYNNLEESWKDHKALLLNAERYKPFTEVMYDYTKAAWAIKRAGYATDPNYPIKLIDIIYKYDLVDLDKIEI